MTVEVCQFSDVMNLDVRPGLADLTAVGEGCESLGVTL